MKNSKNVNYVFDESKKLLSSAVEKIIKVFIRDVTPHVDDLWHGIGGHFDSISQVLDEFVDNAISTIIANTSLSKTVIIKVYDNGNDTFTISIEDTGEGIDDFEKALKLGNREVKDSPLNEHGFGIKHALASADPENRNWDIYTRTQDDSNNNIIRRVSAPYQFNFDEETLESNMWPGDLNFNSGTLIKFDCSSDLFYTLRKGFSTTGQFEKCMEYLCEDLGYIYSKLLIDNGITISVVAPQIDFNQTIKPVLPKWVGYYHDYKPGVVEKDLGRGRLKIEYEFGEVENSNHKKYYRKNPATQGAEIRINGRVLESGVFEKIWGKEKHPSYNHFLGIINLKSSNSNALPVTRTSKNGIRSDDKVLLNLYEWIGRTIPMPQEKVTDKHNEEQMIEMLKQFKKAHIRAMDKSIETEFEVYKKLGGRVFVDLLLFDGTDLVAYEAKKDNARIQDLYQLIMYWDGLVCDGHKPDEGILLANTFSDGLESIVKDFNQRKDANGNNYNIKTKTWAEEGIKIP